ncbi:tyrosine-protein kinase receptor Tie-1-like [Antedon mediterranea]|uniref:tyrosine-protein kinase receptor Tie-1-like n=1 Tax=Antedon mediterranea TaxID=105859 RepID=UPI003AF95F87
MTLTEGDAVNLRWRLNGNVIDIWSGSSDITIPYVTKDDIGIYECYLNDRRDESKHAIVRLIVRGCSASHYGTDCQNFCPTCYNGGVCDDVSGLCVCPPGFKGEDCSEGCGNNHWGRTCVNLCSSRNPGCPDQMGCVPDPLGCSCMAGYKDLDCKGTCGTGYYGSTCSEQCHCAPGVTCDPSRGCPDGPCEAGYSGTNCQGKAALTKYQHQCYVV